jgi:hypothetical protein
LSHPKKKGNGGAEDEKRVDVRIARGEQVAAAATPGGRLFAEYPVFGIANKPCRHALNLLLPVEGESRGNGG